MPKPAPDPHPCLNAKWAPVASGAGQIWCGCGWRSKTQDDGFMFMATLPDGFTRDAAADHKAHLIETGAMEGKLR